MQKVVILSRQLAVEVFISHALQFQDIRLQACLGFPVLDETIPALTIFYSNPNSKHWSFQWIRLLVGDSTFLQCDNTESYVFHNTSSLTVECNPIG